MKLRPKAYSMGIGGYDIIYKCSRDGCNFKLNTANDDWNFCPKCGTAINWGVVTKVNEEWRQKFLECIKNDVKRQELLAELDQINATLEDDVRQHFALTLLTEQANRKSNAQYFIGNGWTKEELIAQRGFKEEDFNE